MKQDNNDFRTDNLCHFGDSSNYAAEGEGFFEMLQRKAKEEKERQTKELIRRRSKEIADRLLKGYL